MENLIGDVYGLVHLIASTIALITGVMVLLMRKGTPPAHPYRVCVRR